MHVGTKVGKYGVRREFIEDDHVINGLQRRHQFCPRLGGEQRPSHPLEGCHRSVGVNSDHEHVAPLLRSLKITYMAGMQNIKAAIRKRDAPACLAQLDPKLDGSFPRYDPGAQAFFRASTISLRVTEAVPRFMTTNPPAQFAIMAACRKLAPAPNARV